MRKEKIIGFDDGGYYTDSGYVDIQDLTDSQLNRYREHLYGMLIDSEWQEYTPEQEALNRLLATERESTLRENR